MISNRLRTLGLTSLLTVGLVACGSNQIKEEMPADSSPVASATQNTVPALYEIHHDGRIYFFYDRGLYESFLKTGHTAYMKAFIGAGPKGETVKHALTGMDKKKTAGIPSIDLLSGLAKPATPFYGEMRAEGRIYVFDNLNDMEAVRKLGEPPLRYAQIGAGPQGETVVFVLNSSNKKKKPVALIETFKSQNGLN